MHTLAVYGSSRRGDAALRKISRVARGRGDRLTIVSVAYQEAGIARRCGLHSSVWNEICRELAQDDLEKAFAAVDRDEGVELAVVIHTGRHPADALVDQARARGADEIILVDPHASGLGALERRRLRRRSPVPVTV
jgi:hypothetical protein